MSKVITHSGTAHRDDFLSLSFVLCQDPTVEIIERKEPTLSEIKDPEIWVLDVGGQFNPSIKAFDHHQEDWNECTLSLLLKEWRLWDSAIEALPWLEPTVLIDSCGLAAISKEYNIDYKLLYKFQSPVEESFLDLLTQESVIRPKDSLFFILKSIGHSILNKINDYVKLTDLIEKKSIVKKKKDVPIIIFLDGESSRTLSSVIYKYKGKIFGNVRGGLSIIKDDRYKNAVRLYRFNNDRRIDFTRLNKNYQVRFLHEKEFLSVIDLPDNENVNTFIEKVVNTVIT